MLSFTDIVKTVGLAIDGAGVLVIVVGLLTAAFRFVLSVRKNEDPCRQLRQDIGRGILLGLELLVAADIIRTVAVTPTMQGVLILGIIVLIRTFLAWRYKSNWKGVGPGGAPNKALPRAIGTRAASESGRTAAGSSTSVLPRRLSSMLRLIPCEGATPWWRATFPGSRLRPPTESRTCLLAALAIRQVWLASSSGAGPVP